MTEWIQNDADACGAATVPRASGQGDSFTALDRVLRRRVLSQLNALRDGHIVLEDGCGSVALGQSAQAPVRIRVTDPAFYQAVAAGGSVGAGEAYMAGHWHCDDLVSLVRTLVRNRDVLDSMESGWARLGGWALRRWHALRRNTLAGSRRNIAAHYDLGNEFFSLFLSADQMYSAAYWLEGEDHSGRRLAAQDCSWSARNSNSVRRTTSSRSAQDGAPWRSMPPTTMGAGSRPPPYRRSSTRPPASGSPAPASRVGSLCCSRTIGISRELTTNWCQSR